VLVGNLIFFPGLSILFYIFVLDPGTAYFQSKALPRLEKGYNTMIAFALDGKMAIKVFAGTVVLLFLSIILLGILPPKVTFFPDGQPNLANIYLELPVGTDIEVTNTLTKQLEAEIVELMSVYTYDRDGKPYNYLVESIVAQVGKGTGDPQEGPSQNATPHKAKIIVAFREAKLRVDGDGQTFVSTLALQRIREQLSEVPGASIVVEKDQMGPPQGAAINMEVTGNSYPEVLAQAERLKAMIESSTVTGYDELKLDIVSGKPELPITVDRAKARSLGISTSQIGDGLRTALFGKEISRFKTDDDDYPINLRFANNYRYNLEDLMNQRITFRDQSSGKIVQVPISTLATASKSSTFSAVKRKDLKRVITLYSGVREGANANEVVESIKTLLADVTYPEGISMSFTGQQEAQAKEMAFLSKALLGAVFMIFLIMVSLFNSARIPILIMVTVILSLIGVFSGLLIFRMEFVVIMTMIGIISLAGVVVNNAIVMADYAGQLLSRKKEELGIEPHEYLPVSALAEPLAQAGVTRLRPVLLTAITTILGLLPLATGMNFDFFSLFTENDPQLYFGGDNVAFWGPISWTVIFGLTFATFLTLVIVPVMLFLTERIRSKRYYRKITAA
jgi:multidrug efflux pump subunit AcrB